MIRNPLLRFNIIKERKIKRFSSWGRRRGENGLNTEMLAGDCRPCFDLKKFFEVEI